jgi:hypothetical protein
LLTIDFDTRDSKYKLLKYWIDEYGDIDKLLIILRASLSVNALKVLGLAITQTTLNLYFYLTVHSSTA